MGNYYPGTDPEQGYAFNPLEHPVITALMGGGVIAATACAAGGCEAIGVTGVLISTRVAIGRLAGKTGTIYKVPGKATASGKPYYGRHYKPNSQETRRSNDGRDRRQSKAVDTYDTRNPAEGRVKEQKPLDKDGLENTDNKRNEIAPENRQKVEDEAKKRSSWNWWF